MTEQTDTYEDLVGHSRADLLARLEQVMSPNRLQHVLGVEQTARALALTHDYDPERAGLAALLHDYAKELPDQVFLDLIDEQQLNPDLKVWGNNVWHGMVGIYQIQKDLSITDPEILRAIEVHTVGSAEMSLLDKIVYIADYIEPGRDFPGVDTARELANSDLNQAVAYATAHTVSHLATQGVAIYPQTLETYNAYIGYLPRSTSHE